jgi:hypothetical protein
LADRIVDAVQNRHQNKLVLLTTKIKDIFEIVWKMSDTSY